MTHYLLIGYLLGMVTYVLAFAEDALRNKDNDPDVEFALGHPAGPALMALFAILLSPLWPAFALRLVSRWLVGRMRAATVRLREIAAEDAERHRE